MAEKRTNNDLLHITTQKTKNRATQTPLKTGGEFRCYTIVTRRVTLVTSPVINHE
jgi:hypothetical protein